MFAEIPFVSLLVPGLLPAFVSCAIAFWIVDRVLARAGLYRRVWHPALFRVSAFVCVFCGVALLFAR
ncbi:MULTISPECIES: DUF1656 domain-containing protein [Burkholderia]|uniref:DUF1656 domain-containing protein n=1 Tax=Burkholderia TaxID=32008 RepID=UPI000CFFD683|nr:DUF1656 domain-containing protein [Burkholderia multivorans]MBU9164205.1 DUF1656 domain-containing protein [Burkholderia multivorans]MBU9263029.1 DUF1656 domain-containing protein [Burkholderia multivorans]MBU9490002.1 DUF1656 domain-containing protein [Burkholderia multivorans]MBU9546116.1 DUF1656 domain-containing protein [Burkholderia multivorans]MCA8177866.1 DUF1656 domain-containing protein [Burkholderia multivorans]